MTNPPDHDGKFDDTDLYGVFSSDSLMVPEELDLLILNAAEAEVSKVVPQQEDSTSNYRTRGLSGIWAQAFAVAAMVAGAVILVPLLTPTNDTRIVADTSTAAGETTTLVSTEAVRDNDGSNLDSDASVDLAIDSVDAEESVDRDDESVGALANDSSDLTKPSVAENLKPLVSGGGAGMGASTNSDATAAVSEATVLRMAESESDRIQEETAESKQMISRSAEARRAESPADATDVDDSDASNTQTNEVDAEPGLEKGAEAESSVATAAIADAVSSKISASPEPAPAQKAREANFDTISNARDYRKTELLWIEEIVRLHDNNESTRVRTELRFFKLVYPDSDRLKKLPAEILQIDKEK